jgi:hypothetical protein
VAKTAKAGAQVRSASTGSRPPLNLAALDALDAIRAVVAWREQDLTMLARHDRILRLKADADAAVRAAKLVLEPPPARVDVGPCAVPDCPGSARAGEGEPEARCDTCGTVYAVREHLRARVLAALDDGAPVRAAQAARLLTAHGVQVKAGDIRNWWQSGRLKSVGHEQEGKRSYALYSVSDIYEVASSLRRVA